MGSWGFAAFVLLATIGVRDCGKFRTCAVPTCSQQKLPFGLTPAALAEGDLEIDWGSVAPPTYFPQARRHLSLALSPRPTSSGVAL